MTSLVVYPLLLHSTYPHQVVAAPSTCPLSPATSVGLHAWVSSDKECEELCQENKECAAYRLEEGGQGGGSDNRISTREG